MAGDGANVPELRFPEFEGEWVEHRLDELFHISAGGDVDSNHSSDVQTGKFKFPIYANSLKNRGLYGFSDLTRQQGGCITITGRGSLGTPFARDHSFYPIVRLLVLRPKDDANIWFFEAAFSRIQFYVESTGVPQLTGPQVSSYKIAVTALPEQQKIAAFLGAVDGKIGQLEKKKALLEDYKKGCMQKLFSRTLRFKDDNGNDFPDWEEKRLGEIGLVFDGTHQTPTYVDNGVPFYSVEHVTADDFSKTKFITEAIYQKECRRVRIERNDILLTRIGDIGTACLVDWDVRASFYVSLALIKLDNSVVAGFINQFVQSDYFQRELWHRTIHVAFPKKINLGEIGQCMLKLPHPDEQQKIANFLTAIDEKISVTTNQLTQAQNFKKGLLQQMFV